MARPRKIVAEITDDVKEVAEIQPVAPKAPTRKDGRIALEKNGGIKFVKSLKQIALLEADGWERV